MALSPCVAPGTVSNTPYNHYTMLRSVEDMFGLPHLGSAGLSGETSFGSDVFTQPCQGAGGAGGPASSPPPPVTRVHAPGIASSASAGPRIPISWSASEAGARFTLQVRDEASPTGAWRTLLGASTRRSLRFPARLGRTYEFQVRAVADGAPGAWSTAATIVPTGPHPAGSRYRGAWRVRRLRGAWHRHAIVGRAPGATLSLRYTGGEIAVIGERGPNAGRIRVTLDGHIRTIDLHSSRTHIRRVLFRARPRVGRHRLTIRVLSGAVAIEGFAIGSRRG